MSLSILENVSLAPYTSWQIGGEAEFFCLPTSLTQLHEALQFAQAQNLSMIVIGGGSNILIADSGITGLVICSRKLSQLTSKIQDGFLNIECLAGTSKTELLKTFLKHQLEPALFLAGIPGDAGGGVVMNAGVAESISPREFMEIVESIDVMTAQGQIFNLKKADLKISYRHTSGWQPNLIVKVYIRWPYLPQPQIIHQVKEANRLRLAKQPLDKPSCGSVFRNPEGLPEGLKAAQLIDQCGLKGFRIGDAQVSLKHANFIVNLDAATARDTWAVICHVQEVVKAKKNVELLTEVVRLGEW